MPRFQVRNAPYSIYVNGVDGVANNALSCANSSSLNPTAAWSFVTWFKPVGTRKAFVLFDNSESGSTLAPTIIIGSNGSTSFYSTVNGVSRTIVNATSRIVAWGEWNCLGATYTGSAINLFLNDGQLTEQITGISGALGTNTGRLRLGAYFTGGVSLTMQGYIWLPQVFAAGMSASEFQALRTSAAFSSTLSAGLRLNPPFTEGSGTTASDDSGYGNTITLGASASWSTDTPFKLRTVASARTLAAPRTLAGPRTLAS